MYMSCGGRQNRGVRNHELSAATSISLTIAMTEFVKPARDADASVDGKEVSETATELLYSAILVLKESPSRDT